MTKADFNSLRGTFKFNTNHYPIQDFYLVKVAKRPDGKYETEIVQKVFEDYADAYAKDCPMKSRRELFKPEDGKVRKNSQPEHEDHRGLRQVAHFHRTRQLVAGIAEQAGGDGDVLLAADRIGHGRGIEAGARIDLPQLFEGFIVDREDGAVDQRRDDDAAGGGERTAVVRVRQLLALLEFAGAWIEHDDADR